MPCPNVRTPGTSLAIAHMAGLVRLYESFSLPYLVRTICRMGLGDWPREFQ